jgi:hypothetical protein
MATAVATVSLTDERDSWVAGNKYMVEGFIAISPSPATYVTGGIPCSFFLPLIKATFTPNLVLVTARGLGTTGTLFGYVYVPGADASAGLLKIFTSNGVGPAGLAELPAAAIPADVSGDTIKFLAIFPGQN